MNEKRGTQLAMIFVAAAALHAAPLAGQQSARGSALVVIPPVAELELQSASAIETRGTADGMIAAEGSLLVRVRANHEWRVFVEAPNGFSDGLSAGDGAGHVWWRATVIEQAAAGDYQQLIPGETAVAAQGGRGQVVIRIDYRWTGSPGHSYDAVPLTYTLSSL